MKTSNTNPIPAPSFPSLLRTVRGTAIACALISAALFAQGAFAQIDLSSGCPPPNHLKGLVCVPPPTPPPPRMKTVVPHIGAVPITKPKPTPQGRPGQAPPPQRYMKTVVPSPAGVVPITKHKTPKVERRIVDPNKVPPQIGPGPLHVSTPKGHASTLHYSHGSDPAPAASSAKWDLRANREAKSDTHGIIFVGGHSQNRIDHNKAALNPQPIPPGHSLRRIPHRGAPLETGGH